MDTFAKIHRMYNAKSEHSGKLCYWVKKKLTFHRRKKIILNLTIILCFQ